VYRGLVTTPGLRERKKEQTRAAIAEAALRLFAERGFDAVTVAEVAEAANVSTATVFNYFPTKEDLLYSRFEAFEEELLAAVRDRPVGESVLDAFGRFIIERSRSGANRDLGARVRTTARIISDSRALLERERQIVARYADALAELIADETGAKPDDLRPRVAAGALMAVHRALIDSARRRARSGRGLSRLAADLEAEGERALALLREGLGGYAVKRR
jgi:AcrR family transcriptional regulator